MEDIADTGMAALSSSSLSCVAKKSAPVDWNKWVLSQLDQNPRNKLPVFGAHLTDIV